MAPTNFNGAALAAIRERSGVSQSELAKDTGLGQGYISELESGGKSNPRPATIKKLADALNVSMISLARDVIEADAA